MIRINYSFIILFLLPSLISAQEVIVPLNGNPVAEEYFKTRTSSKKSISADTLDLPFIDDFSDSNIVPDPAKWVDKNAFINNQYSRDQVTAGIATLDAYTAAGSHYPNAGKVAYLADYLTSQPVDLDLPLSANIYLSFYYQAKGLGEIPEAQDSLCVEFFEPAAEQWNRIWSVPGDTIMDDFAWVILPINEEKYLQKGFQFRFLNYASQSANNDFSDQFSNVDHWHIDYVILDSDRNINDSILRDVSFTKAMSSILKDYESIPWTHLEQAYFTQRKPTIEVEISNMDTATRNVTKTLKMFDLYNNFTYSPTPTANDIFPGEIFDFNFEYDYPFDFNTGDSALFLIQAILRTDAFDYKPNDTLEYLQVLKNYYAYDDGSAEAGYGLNGQGTQNASVAVRFNSFLEDSLRAVDIYFNQVVDSLNLNYYFYLNVWDDNNGKPGNIIYSQIGERPAYGNTLNQPVRYHLDSTIAVEDVFYVGWTKTVDKMANVGVDLNRDNSSNNLYSMGSGWLKSLKPVSIMLRPVLSKTPLLTSSFNTNSFAADEEMKLYPNPASRYVQLEFSSQINVKLYIQIYDYRGRLIKQLEAYPNEPVPTGDLENGIYILRSISPYTQKSFTQKFIIQH